MAESTLICTLSFSWVCSVFCVLFDGDVPNVSKKKFALLMSFSVVFVFVSVYSMKVLTTNSNHK